MRVDLYTLCWNEVDMLGFFFRHYDPWVDRYFIYDDGSTDGSLDLLAQHPKVVLRRFERSNPNSFVLSHQAFHNEVWKESRGQADWVVITALDEHLHVHNRRIADYLSDSAAQGVTLVPALGYQMLSHDVPESNEWLCQSRTIGAPYADMNKLSILNPDALKETGFAVGRHHAQPRGEVRLPTCDELMLLHYKYLNFDRTLLRHQEESQGLGEVDRANGWGAHYAWSADELGRQWAEFQAKAVDIGAPDFEPTRAVASPRWWRFEDFSAYFSGPLRPSSEVAERDAEIRRLQSLLEEQTTWNLRMRADLTERETEIRRLQDLVDEQVRWNLALRAERRRS